GGGAVGGDVPGGVVELAASDVAAFEVVVFEGGEVHAVFVGVDFDGEGLVGGGDFEDQVVVLAGWDAVVAFEFDGGPPGVDGAEADFGFGEFGAVGVAGGGGDVDVAFGVAGGEE